MLHLYSEIPPFSGHFGLRVCEIINFKTKLYVFKTVVLVFFFPVIYNMFYYIQSSEIQGNIVDI